MYEKVSVIVPVYNVEAYLDRCVETILKQTYSNIEVLLIDDGSKDRSGEMCDWWAEKDCRVQVIHQKNSGVSVSRNYGIDIAQGDFVMFVDSDDWLENDMIETLIRGCQKSEADVALCTYNKINANEVVMQGEGTECIYTGEEALQKYLEIQGEDRCFCNAVWNKLYRHSVIKDVYFPKGRIIAEELGFMTKVYLNAKKVYCIDVAKYNYVEQRPGSVTNEEIKEKIIYDEIVAREEQIDLLRDSDLHSYLPYCFENLYKKIYLYSYIAWRRKRVWNYRECKKMLVRVYDKYEKEYLSQVGKGSKYIEASLYKNAPIIFNCILAIKGKIEQRNK